MAFDYSGLITPFSDIIDEFEMGTVSILRRVQTKDPDDPWDYTVAETETNIKAIVTGVSEDKVDNESILNTDFYVLFSSASVDDAPETSDYLRIDGSKHSIIKVNAVPPAGTTIIYRCQCRRV